MSEKTWEMKSKFSGAKCGRARLAKCVDGQDDRRDLKRQERQGIDFGGDTTLQRETRGDWRRGPLIYILLGAWSVNE